MNKKEAPKGPGIRHGSGSNGAADALELDDVVDV
jgi:hypothetical protein